MKKCQMSNRGFTLIEMLVVMGAFVMVSSLIAGIILTHVRAVDKVNTETAIRQTGNNIISQMAREIRNAGEISCPTPTPENLRIVPKLDPSATITYSCDLTNKKITKTGADLNDITQVVLSACSFICSSPIVDINFTLEEETSPGSSLSKSIGQKVSIPFQTSVQMRNQ